MRLGAFALAAPFCLSLYAQDAELQKAAALMASRIAANGETTVAVVDFSDLQGRTTELGRYYAEELSIALVNVGTGLKIIDRAHLQTLLKELKLQSSGLIDERTAQELGRVAGVNVLITGSVTELASQVRLSLKAMSTKTAAIQAAASLNLPKDASTMALLRRDVSGAAVGVAAPGAGQPRGTAPDARVFQNDFLIVGVESISLRKERNTLKVHLSLGLENKSAQEVYVGMKNSHAYSLMDSLGRSWRPSGCTGLSSASNANGNFFDRTRYARIAPGSKQTVVLAFDSKEEVYGAVEGGAASFAMELVRHIPSSANRGEGQGEFFTVGISNIPMVPAPEPKAPPEPARGGKR